MPDLADILPFDLPGRFWRGNLHTHSNRSDGALPPEEVCRRYRAEGYDFLALTDHFIGRYGYPITDTKPFRTSEFTTILGAELHSGAQSNGDLWHILAVGLPSGFAPSCSPDFKPVEGQETGPELAARAVAAGAFVAVAHPSWSGLTFEDAMSVEAAHAVEVYNHACSEGADRADGWAMADLMASAGRQVFAIATDDAHFVQGDHFGAWMMVKAEENTPEALLAALKAGRFYATQGPELRGVELLEDRIRVTSTAVRAVIVQGHGCAAAAVDGDAMTAAEVPLDKVGRSDWLRVTVIDAAGKRAWTNPFRR